MQVKETNTTVLLSKEILAQNQAAVEIVDFYSKVSSIIERTHIAMGKKATFKISNSSTKDHKIISNVFAPTH